MRLAVPSPHMCRAAEIEQQPASSAALVENPDPSVRFFSPAVDVENIYPAVHLVEAGIVLVHAFVVSVQPIPFRV